MDKIHLSTVTGGNNNSLLNDNFKKIEEALNDGVMWRQPPEDSPNDLKDDVDMNGQRIYNLPAPVEEHEPARYKEAKEAVEAIPVIRQSKDEALEAAMNAKQSEIKSKISEEQSQGSKEAAKGSEEAAKQAEKAAKDARDKAILAADSSGDFRIFFTKAEAVAALPSLPNGQKVEVQTDEGYNGQRIRYKVEAGSLVFMMNMDRLEEKLASPEGARAVTFGIRTQESKNQDTPSVLDWERRGGDDTSRFQAAIDACYGGTLFIPAGTFTLSTLNIKGGIQIKGASRGLYPSTYATTRSKLQFTLTPAGAKSLNIFDPNGRVSGVSLTDLLLTGTLSTDGIQVGESISRDVTELFFHNVGMYNFKDAFTSTYCYGATLSGFRVQSAVNALLLNSQTNQMLLSRCGLVSLSGDAVYARNCEGIRFDSCNISNLSKTSSAPITLFQSSLIFDNMYGENIDHNFIFQVGTGAEVASAASTLTVRDPFKLGDVSKRILAANPNVYVEVSGRGRYPIAVTGNTAGMTLDRAFVRGLNDLNTAGRTKENLVPGSWRTFLQYGGGVLTQERHKGFIRVTNTGGSGSGLRLSETLEAGKVYTLTYAIRKTATPQTVNIRVGDNAATSIEAIEMTDGVQSHSCSFIAQDANLRLLFQGAVDLYGYRIVEGNLRTPSEGEISLMNTALNTIQHSPTEPVGTGWVNGDICFSTNPTASKGWVRVSGAWQPMTLFA